MKEFIIVNCFLLFVFYYLFFTQNYIIILFIKLK